MPNFSVAFYFALNEYTTVGSDYSLPQRWRLLEGLDDIGLTLRQVDAITEFEKARPSYKPTTLPEPVDAN